MLSVIIPSVVILFVILPSVDVVNVIMLNVTELIVVSASEILAHLSGASVANKESFKTHSHVTFHNAFLHCVYTVMVAENSPILRAKTHCKNAP
jgi:hypothetical protein